MTILGNSIIKDITKVAKEYAEIEQNRLNSSEEIPISTAKNIAKKHGYDQVIILARQTGEDGLEWVTTYGVNKQHCAAAAKIGDALRDDVIPTLNKLRARIAELENKLENIAR